MIGLVQRVSEGRVEVNGETLAAVGRGLLVLVGIQRGDTERHADRLLERLLSYRIFPDDDGKMNLSLQDIAGGLLLVPQFTLTANTRKGTRPSFSGGADPDLSRSLFDYLVQQAKLRHTPIGAGRFSADMAVSLTNDGPVTFWLEVPPDHPTKDPEH